MKQTKNVPQLRFSGFDDDWEEKKLGEIVTEVKRKADSNSTAPVMMISATQGFINQSEKYSADNAGSSLKNYTLLKKGELSYNHGYSKTRNFGSCFTLEIDEARIPFVYHSFSLDSDDSSFFGKYLNSGLFDKELKKRVASTARMDGLLNISFDEYVSLIVKKPTLAEQQKIGTFLSHVDSLIQAKTKKLESLKAVKKSFLQKCFPKAGEKVPEMRFAGFSGDWGEKKLGEIAEKFDYGLNAAATDFDGKNKYLRITDIDDENRYFKYDDVSSPDCILSESENYLLRENDIVFARTGASVGKAYIYNKQDGIVYFAGFLIRAHIKQEYDSLFIFQNTLSEPYNKYIQITSQRSGQPGVNAEEYKEYSVMCPPTLAEQQKIGQFFSKYDSLISAQQKEIDKLKDIKKALLQKMFI